MPEIKIDKEIRLAPNNNSPKYPINTSIKDSFEKINKKITKKDVNKRLIEYKNKRAKNFPKIISLSEIGKVNKTSIVFNLFLQIKFSLIKLE